MTNSATPTTVLTRDRFDAVIFDMDGVVTDTAGLHGKSWKEMFDRFLEEYAQKTGGKQEPFDLGRDYLEYVDGKPRFDGVRSFLASRGISLPEGSLEDEPGMDSVFALGNWKNELFGKLLREEGAVAYPGTLDLIRKLHAANIKTAIISSSKNAEAILRSANVLELFEVKVDGVDSLELDIKGKPAPDIFWRAAEELDVEVPRAVVVEDAISGVQAGKAGKFGLVIGVSRGTDPEALRRNGADVVVADLSEVSVA
ncbi:MAG: beta-phosphoglucomutase family hydrolase [Desulfovibrionales bacterium]|nr:MAG: beta-phosphoglucomutase family hydrolase [Desulfovibrionales bacterium]